MVGARSATRNRGRQIPVLKNWPILTAACSAAALLSACSTIPSAGPTAAEIVNQGETSDAMAGYVLIDIDHRTASILSRQPRETLYGRFKDRRPAPDVRIGVGDALTVTIWEAAAGGLFSAPVMDRTTPGSRTASIPVQVVDQAGTIQVPYAGRIRVSGRRPSDVEAQIVEALKGKAIEPQAVVSIAQNSSNTVTVTGEVTNGARVPLGIRGDRILDVVGSAGGIRSPAHESFIRLTRGNETVNVAFNTILANPQENIFVRPRDIITVVRDPQSFTAFGGTGTNASVPFNASGITLEEGIAKAGGLLDQRADASGVFLLRFEPAKLVHELRPDLPDRGTPSVPVVYRLNMKDANSYFLARSISMRNKDILYVANAPMAEIQKVFQAIGTLTSPVIQGAAVYSATR